MLEASGGNLCFFLWVPLGSLGDVSVFFLGLAACRFAMLEAIFFFFVGSVGNVSAFFVPGVS